MRRRGRPHFTTRDIEQQLQQLYLLSSSVSTSSSDVEQLAPVIRNIAQSRQQDAYLKALKSFVAAKQAEIESVCARNYQDLIQYVSALLRVRQGTVSLKHRVIDLNEDLQKSGGGVVDKRKELLDSRRVGQNIDEAIDTLQTCLGVLDVASQVQSLTNSAKYFSALRQIDELQATRLTPVLHYPFATLMLASLPVARSAIKEEVTRSLKAWMFEARSASRSVGRNALEAMDARGRRWASKKRKETNLTLARVNGPVELVTSERHEFNFVDNDEVTIDFRPMHNCILIYDLLGCREELQLSYQADRKAQAYLLLSQSAPTFSLPSLSLLLEEIVGFFLIESHVLRTTDAFRSEQDVEDLWDSMCERVVSIVGEGLAGCEDPEVFLGTKFKIMTFVQALERHEYSVSRLNNLLLMLFERYSELLQRKFSGDFEQIVLDDDHQCMVVNDAEEFEKVVSVSWLPPQGEWSAAELSHAGFPLALPFSQTYPLCCIDIRSFTEQYYQFAEGFADRYRDIDDVLRKALDKLLIQQVSQNIQKRLQEIHNISQLSQIVVNVLFFQTACSELESLLVTLRATQRGGTIHLESLASFQATLRMALDKIIVDISSKLDSFFEEADYQWEATVASRDAEPSSYLRDLVDFIQTIMLSVLVQLPDSGKDHVFRGALAHCASLMRSFLIDEYPSTLSDAALATLECDVKYLESQASDRTLDTLAELSQTLSLLRSPSLMEFAERSTTQPRWAKVQPKVMEAAVAKMAAFWNLQLPSMSAFRRKQQLDDALKALQARRRAGNRASLLY